MNLQISSDMTVKGTQITVDGKQMPSDNLVSISFYADKGDDEGRWPDCVSVGIGQELIGTDGTKTRVNQNMRKLGEIPMTTQESTASLKDEKYTQAVDGMAKLVEQYWKSINFFQQNYDISKFIADTSKVFTMNQNKQIAAAKEDAKSEELAVKEFSEILKKNGIK